MTGITPPLRNLVSMAEASLTLGDGYLVDRVQSVSHSPVHYRYTIHTHSIHSDGMAYNTGSRDDWDRISRITGDPAWTWDAMAHYRDLNQRYVPPNDGHDDVRQKRVSSLPRSYRPSQTNQYLPWAHSRDGMVPISLPGFPEDIDSRVIATTAESGFVSEFPFQRDMNTGDTVRLLAVVHCPNFFYRPPFMEIDRGWLGTGCHWQWPAQQLCHHLRRTGLH